MNEQVNFFDVLPEEEAAKIRPIKSTDWKWTFADYPKEKNGLKVFSCFACGGGSTMGYKLAGCDVIGCCEIDKRMNDVYVKNHNPKYNFLMDIRKFNEIPDNELPIELFNLDILDGSPPCTTFSTAGDREESWGKKKKFREGQAEQTLDDLSFVFIETAKKLKPKTVIMENVEGLLLGEAWSYVQRIYKEFKDAGYQLKHYLCKAEYMGVPQRRHRMVFIAIRNDIEFDFDKLNMEFNYAPILYGEIKDGKGENASEKALKLLNEAKECETLLSDAHERLYGSRSWFTHMICNDNKIMPTIPAGHSCLWDFANKKQISKNDIINAQTFPQDFNFIVDTFANINYICGMSVPPIMTKRVVERLIATNIFKEMM